MYKDGYDSGGDPFQALFAERELLWRRAWRAHNELHAVHRRELAKLLVAAARWALGLAGTGSSPSAFGTLLEPVGLAWRTQARIELELLHADQCHLVGMKLLELALDGRERDQPRPELMVLAALELWGAPSSYLALGQVLLVRGESERAKEVYAELLRRDENGEFENCSSNPWRIREGLAAAWESLGSDRLALGCLDRAVEYKGSGAGPLVSALFLSLELGDHQRAVVYAAKLDARLGAGSLRLAACVEGLGERIQLRNRRRESSCWTPPQKSVKVFRALLRGTGASAGICRAMVGMGGMGGESKGTTA
jgi:tetratricopeptide (TPR) repeat protein